jgi:hypothetical protein
MRRDGEVEGLADFGCWWGIFEFRISIFDFRLVQSRGAVSPLTSPAVGREFLNFEFRLVQSRGAVSPLTSPAVGGEFLNFDFRLVQSRGAVSPLTSPAVGGEFSIFDWFNRGARFLRKLRRLLKMTANDPAGATRGALIEIRKSKIENHWSPK